MVANVVHEVAPKVRRGHLATLLRKAASGGCQSRSQPARKSQPLRVPRQPPEVWPGTNARHSPGVMLTLLQGHWAASEHETQTQRRRCARLARSREKDADVMAVMTQRAALMCPMCCWGVSFLLVLCPLPLPTPPFGPHPVG